jgi:hypothetical protein
LASLRIGSITVLVLSAPDRWVLIVYQHRTVGLRAIRRNAAK